MREWLGEMNKDFDVKFNCVLGKNKKHMKVVTIYHLGVQEFEDEDLEEIFKAFNASALILFKVDNQMENIQYPYISVETHDS